MPKSGCLCCTHPQILVGGSLDPIAEEQEDTCSAEIEDAPAQEGLPSAKMNITAAPDIAVPSAEAATERHAAGGAPEGTLAWLAGQHCKIF